MGATTAHERPPAHLFCLTRLSVASRVDLRSPYRRGDPRTKLDKLLASLGSHVSVAPEAKGGFLERLRNALLAATA